MQRRTSLLIMGILIVDFFLALCGVFSENWFSFPRFKMLSFSVASIGVVTFIGFFTIAYESGPTIERAIRNAIAASVIVMYLVTVGIVTYFPPEITTTVKDISGKFITEKELNPLTKTMLESFQTVLTVVIGFYFASSTVVEGIQRMKKDGNEQDK
jgi:hypothetical protein